jgi:hypothetical protein
MVFSHNKRGLLFFVTWIIVISTIILLHSEQEAIGDEYHYIKLASRLLEGWYTNSEELDLWYGPGYPIMLAIFMLFSKNFVFLRLTNALFIAGSMYLVWRCYNTTIKPIVLNALLIFVYLNLTAHKIITQTMTESFMLFLVTAAVVVYLKRDWPLLLGFLLGLLALTKVVFYLIFPLVFLCFVAINKNINWKYATKVVTMVCLVSLPYLFYTYSLTQKIYYVGTSGGQNLYWQATSKKPLKGEWQHYGAIQNLIAEANNQGNTNLLLETKRQEGFFASIQSLNPVEQDIKLKQFAVNEILSNPQNYIRNTFYTMSRMFFSWPVSEQYSKWKLLFYIPNGIIQLLMLGGFFYLIYIKGLKGNIFIVLLIAFYLCVHFALNGLARQYLIVTPVILIIGIQLWNQKNPIDFKSK